MGETVGMVQAQVKDRLVAGVGTALILLLLGWVLLSGLTVRLRQQVEPVMALLDLRAPPPPPPRPPRPPVEPTSRKAPRNAPSPRNLKAQATKVVAPPPVILPPVPPPVIVAPVAGVGAAPSSGASDRRGPGWGAGGEGFGTGGGGEGGEGDGIAPVQIKGRLKYSDLPEDLRGRDNLSVAVRYRVAIDGRVDRCSVTRSSGSAELDQLTCGLIEQRFRFKPSRDETGEPVQSFVVETHSWAIDRSDYDPAPPD
jgi:protein TonB